MVIVFSRAFEKGVGEIKQRDRLGDLKQRSMLVVDKRLDLIVVFPQQVRGAIQSRQALLAIITI